METIKATVQDKKDFFLISRGLSWLVSNSKSDVLCLTKHSKYSTFILCWDFVVVVLREGRSHILLNKNNHTKKKFKLAILKYKIKNINNKKVCQPKRLGEPSSCKMQDKYNWTVCWNLVSRLTHGEKSALGPQSTQQWRNMSGDSVGKGKQTYVLKSLGY